MVNNYFGIYVQALLAKNSVTKLQKELNAIKNLQVKVTPTLGTISKDAMKQLTMDFQNEISKLQQESSKIDIDIDTQNLAKSKQEITEISDVLDNDLNESLKDTTQNFGLFDNFLNQSSKSFDNLLGIVSKVAIWGVATNAVYGTKRAIQELFQTYVELEDKLISIERVTNNFDMSAIFDGAYQSAQKYGASLNDMLNSIEEVARSYSNLTEAEVLAASEAGILASTIAEMNGETAVQAIIAVSNAYDLAIENGQRLIDMANEVDNNFSVTATDIATAWEKSAATAKVFGVEIQNLTGYIAAISTVTQESGAVIGNSLKTIFSRITTMDEAISAINNIGVDVFDETTGHARDVEDVLSDLADKWDNLSSSEQQNLGVKVAGRYQLTRFLALMDNWNIALDASATALDSEGSAAAENAKYLESYTAKITQLENAQAALSEAIFNSNISGWGKAWVELKINLTEAATAIFKYCDAMTLIISLMPTVVALLSKTTNGYKLLKNALMFVTTEEKADIALKKMQNSWLLKNAAATKVAEIADKGHALAIQMKAAALISWKSGAKGTAIVDYLLAAATNTVTLAMKALSIAMNMIPGMALAAILGFVVNALTGVSDSANGATESIDELNNSLADLDEQAKSIQEYKNILSDSGSTAEEVASAKEHLLEIENKLKDNYGEQAGQIDLVNGKLEEQLGLVNKLKEQESNNWLRENEKSYNNAKKEMSKKKDTDIWFWGSNTYEQTEMLGDIAEKLGYNSRTNGNKNSISNWVELKDLNPKESMEAWGEIYDYLREHEEELRNQWGLSEEYYQQVLNDVSREYGDYKEKVDKYGPIIEQGDFAVLSSTGGYYDFIDQISALGENGQLTKSKIEELLNTNSNLKNAFNEQGITVDDLVNDYQDYDDALNNILGDYHDNENGINSFLSAADKLKASDKLTVENVNNLVGQYGNLKNQLNDTGISTEQLIEYIKSSNVTLYSNIKNWETLTSQMSALNSNIDDIQNSYLTLSDAMDEYNQNGYFSIDTMQSLLALDERYLLALQNENGQLVLNEQSFRNMMDAQLDEAEASAAAAAILDLETIAGRETGQTIDELKTKYKNLETQLDNTKSSYEGVIQAELAAKAAAGDDEELQRLTNNVMAAYNTKLSIIEKTRKSISNSTFGQSMGKTNNETRKAINYYELAEEALLKYKNAVEAIENELKILQEQQKQNTEGTKAWFDNFAAQEKVVQRYQDAINTYISQIEVQMRNEKLSAEEKTKLSNIIQDLRLEYEKLNTTLHNNIETQKEYYKGEVENKLDLIRDLEDKRHDEALKHIEKEREAFQKQIDEQLALIKKAKDARTYENDLKEIQEQRLDILNQISRLEGDDSRLAKSKLVDLYEQLEDLDSELSDLNYDRDVELREGALDDLTEQMESYYDRLEEIEDNKNEILTESLDGVETSLDDLTWTITSLQEELNKWTNNLSDFAHWASGFDALVSTMPQQNIVSASMPITTLDENGNPVTTEITFQITGSSKDATDIATQVVDSLKQAGVIVNRN